MVTNGYEKGTHGFQDLIFKFETQDIWEKNEIFKKFWAELSKKIWKTLRLMTFRTQLHVLSTDKNRLHPIQVQDRTDFEKSLLKQASGKKKRNVNIWGGHSSSILRQSFWLNYRKANAGTSSFFIVGWHLNGICQLSQSPSLL